PLRERLEDLPLLIAHFLQKFRKDVGRPIERINPAALDALRRHPWPGNVRELQNVVHRAMLACDGPEIALHHLPPELLGPTRAEAHASNGGGGSGGASSPEPVLTLEEAENRAIRRALQAAEGNMSRAAQMLGIGRTSLYRKLAQMQSPGEERGSS